MRTLLIAATMLTASLALGDEPKWLATNCGMYADGPGCEWVRNPAYTETDCGDLIRPEQIEVLPGEIDPQEIETKHLILADLWIDGPALKSSDGDEKPCPKDCSDECGGIGYIPWRQRGTEIVTWRCDCSINRLCSGEPLQDPTHATTEGAYLCALECPALDKTCPTYALRETQASGPERYKVVTYRFTQQGATDPLCRTQE